MAKGVSRPSRPNQSQGQQQMAAAQAAAAAQTAQADKQARQDTVASKVLKYLDDYRSANDIKALREEGYEIDYDRLVGVGANSAVFLAHSVNAPAPPVDRSGRRPLYTPGYDVAAKVVAKKWINSRQPLKIRTGNLKLALALGQTKAENNILKVIDVFKTPDRIFIFMQYCAYGNVISFIRRNGPVPSKLAQRWSAQMAVALSFLHKFHVAHRNYKLENVLVDENLNAKLTGFGLSKFCVDLQSKQPIFSRTICGSEPYLAPEMLRESRERNYDPKQADVWAFGVGVFLCVTRRYPFEADSLRALKQEQLARRYMERDTRRRLRAPVRDLLNAIFTIEPSQRPTMQEIYSQSSWLSVGTIGSIVVTQPPPGPGPCAPAASPKTPERSPRLENSGNLPPRSPKPATPLPSKGRAPTVSEIQTSARNTPDQNSLPKDKLSPVVPVAYPASDALPLETSAEAEKIVSRIN